MTTHTPEPNEDAVSLVGRTVKAVRKQKGFSQGELAKQTGVSQAAISRLEDGRTQSLRSKNLEKFAQVLEVTPAYLLSGETQADTPHFNRDIDNTLLRRIAELEFRDVARSIESIAEFPSLMGEFARKAEMASGGTVPIALAVLHTRNPGFVSVYGAWGNLLITQVDLRASDAVTPLAHLHQTWRDAESQVLSGLAAQERSQAWANLLGEQCVEAMPIVGFDELSVVDVPFSMGTILCMTAAPGVGQSTQAFCQAQVGTIEKAFQSATLMTEDRHRRDELTTRVTLLSGAMDRSSDLVFIVDDQGQVVFANQALREMAGIAVQQLPIQSPDVMLASDHPQSVSTVIEAARKPTPFRAVLRQTGSDGQVKRTGLQFTCYPVMENTAVSGWVNVGAKVTTGKPESIPVADLEQSMKPLLFHMANLAAQMQGNPALPARAMAESEQEIANMFAMAMRMSRISKKSQQMIRSIIKNVEDVGDLDYEEDTPSPA